MDTAIDAITRVAARVFDVPLVVKEAMLDRRFSDNPLVVGTPGVRFYAGVPLTGAEGSALATLAILDTQARDIDAAGLCHTGRIGDGCRIFT